MKIQLLFSFLLIGIQSFIYGMEPESPHSQADMYSGQSTPSRFEYSKLNHGTRSVVFKKRVVGHIIEEVTVFVPINKEIQPTELTQEQRRDSVVGKRTITNGPCLHDLLIRLGVKTNNINLNEESA